MTGSLADSRARFLSSHELRLACTAVTASQAVATVRLAALPRTACRAPAWLAGRLPASFCAKRCLAGRLPARFCAKRCLAGRLPAMSCARTSLAGWFSARFCAQTSLVGWLPAPGRAKRWLAGWLPAHCARQSQAGSAARTASFGLLACGSPSAAKWTAAARV